MLVWNYLQLAIHEVIEQQTFTIAKADVPKPRNIIFEIVLNKESLWPFGASSSGGITTWDWFSVEASTAEDWTSLWDVSSPSIA